MIFPVNLYLGKNKKVTPLSECVKDKQVHKRALKINKRTYFLYLKLNVWNKHLLSFPKFSFISLALHVSAQRFRQSSAVYNFILSLRVKTFYEKSGQQKKINNVLCSKKY